MGWKCTDYKFLSHKKYLNVQLHIVALVIFNISDKLKDYVLLHCLRKCYYVFRWIINYPLQYHKDQNRTVFLSSWKVDVFGDWLRTDLNTVSWESYVSFDLLLLSDTYFDKYISLGCFFFLDALRNVFRE